MAICKPIKKQPANVYTHEQYASQYKWYLNRLRNKEVTSNDKKKKT